MILDKFYIISIFLYNKVYYHYIGSQKYDIKSMTREYNVEIMILGITKVAYIYNNYIIIYLFFIHFIKFNNKLYLQI